MSQLQVTGEAKIRAIQGPVVANSGVITALDGVASQYVRGDGTLANFPTSGGGGGGSVSYYLNGSVNQGNINGSVYYQMSKTPVIGAGTNFSISNNDLIAQFITDANDPSLLEIPAGNWNLEMYFSASSSGGNPSFYVELYKYNTIGGFTLISSSSATPEAITNGTTIDLYTTALAVPSTALTVTDRIMLRIFVNNSGRTITLHTENSHLCQVITTFSTGITALNGLTKQVQYLAVGTSGTDFNIVSSGSTHTFNIPSADGSNRGLVTTGTQSFGGDKSFGGTTTAANLNVSGVLTVFGNLSNGTFGYTLPSAAGQLALTSQIPSITGASYIVSRFNLAGTSLENSSISDTGTYTGSPTGQVTINSRLAVNNFTELNRYLSIAQNPDQMWVPPTSGVNIELFFNSVSGISGYAPDSAYIRARKASDDSLKRLFVLGSELILNQNTSGKTLINKQGAIQTTTKLEVAGYARFDNSINVIGAVYLNATDASQPTYIQAPSGNLSVVTSGTILLRSGANTGVYVADTGFVGINGATPTVALTVSGDGSFTTDDNNFAFNLKLRNTNTGTQALTGLGLSDSADTRKGQVLWIPSNYVTASLQNSFLVSSVTNVPLILCADATGAATPNIKFQSGATDRMTLFGTSGNLAIGFSTDNGARLQVAGAATFSSSVTAGNKITSGAGAYRAGGFYIPYSSASTASRTWAMTNDEIAFGDFSIIQSTTQTGDVNLYRLYINPSGNVGIGTSSPSSKLHVYDTVPSGSTRITVTNASDVIYSSSSLELVSHNGTSPSVGTSIFSTSNNFTYGTISPNQTNIYGVRGGGIRIATAVAPIIFSNGNSDIDFATERMRITSGGNVGIGTSSPSEKLQVNGNISAPQFYASFGGAGFRGIEYQNSGTIFGYSKADAGSGEYRHNIGPSAGWGGYMTFLTDTSERMRITSGGNVLIGTTTDDGGIYRLQVATSADVGLKLKSSSGAYSSRLELQAAGGGASVINTQGGSNTLYVSANNTNGVYLTSGATSWTGNSDERLKNINGIIENALEKIMTLRAVNFSWKSDFENKENLGFIAQDVEKVFPQVIDKSKLPSNPNKPQTDETEYLGVRYQELTPVNTKAIQELYQLVLIQDAKIEELKALIAAK